MDILSALNKNGSGLNITELAETLSSAEITPRKSLVQGRIDTAELRLSGYDRLRGQLETLNDALGMMRSLSPRALRSDNPAVALTLTDPAALDMTGASITVDALASAQVLSFRGFASATTPVGGGSLTVETGAWSDDVPAVFTAGAAGPRSLSFAPDSTLTQIAEQLNTLEGVNARVVDLGDGSFALGVISETGRDNALRFSAPAGSGMAAFDFTADPAAVQVQAGQNAALRLNGIALTRPGNQIDDLLPGVSLTLRAPTTAPATLSVSADTEGTMTVMQGFVDMINATRRLVSDLTDRGLGLPRSEQAALAGDTLALDAVKVISALLSRGFGASDVHLAQIGILTERDGSLSFDTDAFSRALAENPAILDPLLRDEVTASTGRVSGTPPMGTAAGDYTLLRDPATGNATLNGVPVFGNQREDGDWQYRVASGPMRGVTLIVPASSDRTTISYAPSMLNTVQDYLATVTGTGSALADRETSLRQSVSDETIALERLDTRKEDLRTRYLGRFTQMEQVVSQLNSTADYLTNLVDAWNARK